MYGKPDFLDKLPRPEPVHMIALVKWEGTAEFKEIDLAAITGPVYFRPQNDHYTWGEPLPFHPDDMICNPVRWRYILDEYPRLIQVRNAWRL